MSDSPEVTLQEAFDRVHDGNAKILDTSKGVLSVFVEDDGNVSLKCKYGNRYAAVVLRKVADLADLRADAEEAGDG